LTTRKNQNSILVLATLGVYLGLVLVGATPQVLAQAAMTKQFNVKDEVEVKDDLDKKPATSESDDLDADVSAVENLRIAEALQGFILDLKKLEKIGKYDPKADLVFSHKLWKEGFDSTNTVSKNSDIYNPWLETAVGQLISTAENESIRNISDILPSCDGQECREYRVTVESTANDLSLSFAFTKSTPEAARDAAQRFNEVFISKKAAFRTTAVLPIYENTRVTFENNQVTIVTRLPRAGLDSLLAANAK